MMEKIWLAVTLAMAGVMYAFPVQASDGIAAVVVPNPIGIPEIILAVSLLGLASWKKTWIRVILSICLIIWGVFAMEYDIKISAPLIGAGSILFILGILNLIKQYRGGE